jgi:hypothetical protein
MKYGKKIVIKVIKTWKKLKCSHNSIWKYVFNLEIVKSLEFICVCHIAHTSTLFYSFNIFSQSKNSMNNSLHKSSLKCFFPQGNKKRIGPAFIMRSWFRHNCEWLVSNVRYAYHGFQNIHFIGILIPIFEFFFCFFQLKWWMKIKWLMNKVN